MAEEKKVVTLRNESKRHYDTFNAEGKPVRHSPGFTEEYTPEQAAKFDPKEMIDLSKVKGHVDKEALRKENAVLKSEMEALKARLAALEPKPEAAAVEPEPEFAEAGDGRKRKK